MDDAFWPFYLIIILATITGGAIFFLRRINKW